MAVKIRLARAGAKKKPFYRVVVTDSRSPRDGRFIEIVGRYNPRSKPTLVELELDRIKEWIGKGATPSETVEKLIAIAEAPDKPAPATAKDSRVSKKAASAAADAEKAAAQPAPEPEAAPEPEVEAAADAEPEAESEAAADEPAEADAPADDADEPADDDAEA